MIRFIRDCLNRSLCLILPHRMREISYRGASGLVCTRHICSRCDYFTPVKWKGSPADYRKAKAPDVVAYMAAEEKRQRKAKTAAKRLRKRAAAVK